MNLTKSQHVRTPRSRAASKTGRLTRNTAKAASRLLFDSPLLYIPFMALFIMNTTDFVVLFEFQNVALTNLFFVDVGNWTEDLALREAIEQQKSKLKSYVLLFTAVLTLGNYQRMTEFFKNNLNVVFLFAMMSLSILYSIEPMQVVSNVANILFSLFACLLVVIHQKSTTDTIRNALITVFASCSTVVVGSVILWFSLDTDPFEQIEQGWRYAGLTGNPNTLGMLTTITIWTGLAIITEKSSRFFVFPLVAVLIAMAAGLLISTDSATAVVITLLAAAMVLWGRFIQKRSVQTGVVINMVALIASLVVALVFVSVFVGQSYLDAFTTALGKDSSFTGRDNFWAIALEAISQRPILGWGFDNHISVFAESRFDVSREVNHYHNGFLDTIISGGLVLLGALLIHLFWFVRNGFPLLTRDKNVFIAMMPLVLLIIHNLTEYSILRINSMLWVVFLLFYVVLATYGTADEDHVPTKRRLRSGRKTRRRGGFRFA